MRDPDSELRVEAMPELRRPVLIASFRGWNDGGHGASMAGAFLAKAWKAEKFADIDPGALLRLRLDAAAGLARRGHGAPDRLARERLSSRRISSTRPRTPLLLLGSEPSLRWRTFCGLVTDLAVELGVELVVTLGSLLADVTHTRPAPVTASASDSSLVERLGVQPSRYEGPTGIVGVLHDACRAAGIASVSLWAAVPHYVSMTASPPAAKALCDRLATLIDVPVDTSDLQAQSEIYVEQVSEAVASDEDTAAYVEELESRADELDDEGDLPSGDALAAELTRFLREREQDEGDEDSVARDDGP